MKAITVTEISKAVGGKLIGDVIGSHETAVCGVATNSKELKPGEVFFALVAKRDGHEFLADAFAAGAAAAVVSKPAPLPDGTAAVLVKDTLQALGDLAAWYRRRMPATVIGITGSNGKTTTKEMIAHVLSGAGRTVKNPGNFNNNIGVPHTVFQIEPDDRYAVVEMGTSGPGEIRRLAQIAAPQVGVITNVAPTHLEGLGNIKGVAVEKGCLIEALPDDGVAVLNADDHWSREMAQRCRAKLATYGIENAADVRATAVQHSGKGMRFQALGHNFQLQVLGEHNVYNSLAAIAVAHNLGLGLDLVAEQLSTFRLPPMRMERIEVGSIVILNDAYNANLESMRAALREFSQLTVPGRKIVVCGDMLELGEQSDEMHRAIGRRIATYHFDFLLAVGDEARHLARGAAAGGMREDCVLHCPNTEAAQLALPGLLRDGDTILLKASRRMALENLVKAVESRCASGITARTEAAEHLYHTCRAVALH